MLRYLKEAKDWLANIPGSVWIEVGIRLGLFIIFMIFEVGSVSPYKRVIRAEEAWMYKYPTSTSSIVTSQALSVSNIVNTLFTPWIMILSCVAVILISYGVHREVNPGLVALAVPSLAIPLTGIIVNVLKVTVGRPRPDYFNRCYGENFLSVVDPRRLCTGDPKRVNDGRKSFPSGHSSLSFCALGFISVYLASQLRTFVVKGQGSSWRLLVTILPLMAALLVAVSRTCDYHHHPMDVTVGGFIGFLIMYTVYLQYFPPLTSPNCDKPYPFFAQDGNASGQYQSLETLSGSQSDASP